MYENSDSGGGTPPNGGGDDLSRRAALKLTGGTLAGLGGVATGGATNQTDAQPDRYVVYTKIRDSRGSSTLPFDGWIKQAIGHLNRELEYSGRIKFVNWLYVPEDVGKDRFSAWKKQGETFSQVLADIKDNHLSGVKDAVEDRHGERPGLSRLHFIIEHAVGNVKDGGAAKVDSAGYAMGEKGWTGANPSNHSKVGGHTMHATFVGPVASFDPGHKSKSVYNVDHHPKWRTRQMAWQSVGHALGAGHKDGGYKTTGKNIDLVSVMASGHVYDRFGRQDMWSHPPGRSLKSVGDGSPSIPSSRMARKNNDTHLETTDDGCPILKAPGENVPLCGIAEFRFDGWGGKPALNLEKEHAVNWSQKPPEKSLIYEHGLVFTDRAKERITRTLTGQPVPKAHVHVGDSGIIRAGDTLKIAADLDHADYSEVASYDWDAVHPAKDVSQKDLLTTPYPGDEPWTAKLSVPAAGTYDINLSVKAKDVFYRYGPEASSSSLVALEEILVRPELSAKLSIDAETVDADSGDRKRIPVGQKIEFSAADSEGNIERYAWSIDGPAFRDSTTDLSPDATGKTFSRRIFTTGRYSVSLVVDEEEPANPRKRADITASDFEVFYVVESEEQKEDEGTDGSQDAELSVSIEGPEEVREGRLAVFTADVEFTKSSITAFDWSGALNAHGPTVKTKLYSPGERTIELEATNRDGETATATHTVTVEDTAVPEVSIEGPDEVGQRATETYTADASVTDGSVDSYEWGGTVDESEGDTGRATFEFPGEAPVEVTVTSSAGVSATATKTVSVREDPRENRPPSVEIDGPDRVVEGHSATYTASVTDDGEVKRYEWGGVADGTTRETTVSFEGTRKLPVTVTVVDDAGHRATARKQVAVVPPVPGDNRPPSVRIQGPDSVSPGNNAEFRAVATDPDGNPIAGYEWNVGGVSRQVSTSFDSTGTKTVEVTVEDVHGTTASASKEVSVVSDALSAAFSVPEDPTTGGPVTFDASASTGAIANYRWTVKRIEPRSSNVDVPVSGGKTLTHSFEKAATYEVTLTVETEGGETDTTEKTVTVAEGASAFTEGFESGWTGSFRDTSGSGSSPEVTTKHVAEGSQALDLSADPGGNTTNSVLTRTAFESPLDATVKIKRYESGGDRNGAGMAIISQGSGRKVALSQSGYHGGVNMNVAGKDGERIAQKQVSNTDGDGWHATTIRITAEGKIVASAFGDSTTYEPDGDWTGESFQLELQSNGWSGGHEVGAAYDVVRVEEVRR